MPLYALSAGNEPSTPLPISTGRGRTSNNPKPPATEPLERQADAVRQITAPKLVADNVRAELPDVEMMRPCNLCPHMKRITLPKILDSLVYLREEVAIDPVIAEKARCSVERMINLKN